MHIIDHTQQESADEYRRRPGAGRRARHCREPGFRVQPHHAAGQGPQDLAGDAERTAYTFSQKGVLELTHNWGSENDPDLSYHDGNAEPQGFGHICFAVPDLAAAERWFDANDVEFKKRADEGKMPNVVFVKDPDGYWIEVVQPSLSAGLGD